LLRVHPLLQLIRILPCSILPTVIVRSDRPTD
jgi:hypothetical protein